MDPGWSGEVKFANSARLSNLTYNRACGIRNIDDLKDEASSAFQIGMCHGISQNGMIVADATLDGVFRQVLLVPVVPEPPAWLSLAGALGVGLFLKRTRTATDQR